VELNYGRDFALRVLDNGKGIHPDVATAGKPGHFGLQGMQERATRVGGKLSLFSSAKSGTEIELIVPGSLVFEETQRRRDGMFNRLKRILGLA
jgi:signal transduction histidine kinase